MHLTLEKYGTVARVQLPNVPKLSLAAGAMTKETT